jgi:hypothetical protein
MLVVQQQQQQQQQQRIRKQCRYLGGWHAFDDDPSKTLECSYSFLTSYSLDTYRPGDIAYLQLVRLYTVYCQRPVSIWGFRDKLLGSVSDV